MSGMPKLDICSLDANGLNTLKNVMGQIGHDFNNLVAPLTAYPGLIQESVPEGSPARTYAAALEKAATELTAMADRLLLFSGRRASQAAKVDLNDMVRTVAESVSVGEAKATVKTRLAQGMEPARASVEDVICVVNELVRNGVEATPPGGTVEIETAMATEDAMRTAACGMKVLPGRYARVSVRDAGPGLSPEAGHHAFGLFYSLKRDQARRGVGLGLPIVYRAMRDCGGFVEFANVPGGGARFDASFPVQTEAVPASTAGEGAESAEPAHAEAAAGSPKPCDAKRILIVDDERFIRRMFGLVLGSALPAHEIDVVENGAEAVAAFKEKHHALLLMDLRMPVMDGRAAFMAIEAFCSAQNWEMPKVVFCTGFAPPDSVREVVARSEQYHALLSKPVGCDVLIGTVRNRLEMRGRAPVGLAR
jgi:CheY-like chemotaxis protein/nitrogen-specific signal transduction histidine kinase